MEKIQIFEDVIQEVRSNENKEYLIFGNSIAVTNGKTENHNIFYYVTEREHPGEDNEKIKNAKIIFPLMMPVITHYKTFNKKMEMAINEYKRTFDGQKIKCNFILVGGRESNSLFRVDGGNGYYSCGQVKYEIVKNDFFKEKEELKGIESLIKENQTKMQNIKLEKPSKAIYSFLF